MKKSFRQWHQKLKRQLIQDDISFNRLYELLVEMKKENVTKDVAYGILEKIRETTLTEKQEDFLLELMDIVTGYCSPHLRIWD